MKAAVYLSREVVGLTEHELPELPCGWVRIGVTSAGIYGAALHVFHAALGDCRDEART